jgi:elongation factor Ts
MIASVALDVDGGVDAIALAKTPDGESVAEAITHLIATVGENMQLRRASRFVIGQGVVASYVHNATAPDLGRIGVLVALEGEGDQAKLHELGRKIAMHVAATAPLSLSTDDLDPEAVEKERAIFTEQALESGKPQGVVEKMVEGRIRKFFEEVVLLKQAFVMNPDQTIEQLVAETAKTLGSPIAVKGFTRLALGEGVVKPPEDFAAEVAAVSGQG